MLHTVANNLHWTRHAEYLLSWCVRHAFSTKAKCPSLAVCVLFAILARVSGTTATGDAGPSIPPYTPQYVKHIPHVLAAAVSAGSVAAGLASNCTTPQVQSTQPISGSALKDISFHAKAADGRKYSCDRCVQVRFKRRADARRHVLHHIEQDQKRARGVRSGPYDDTPRLLDVDNQQTIDTDLQNMEDQQGGSPNWVARTLVYPQDDSDLDDGVVCDSDEFAPYQEDLLCDGSHPLPDAHDGSSDEVDPGGMSSDEDVPVGIPGDVPPYVDTDEGLLPEHCNSSGTSDSEDDPGIPGEDYIKPKRNRKYTCTRKTAKYYIDRRFHPIHPGAEITVLGSAYLMCEVKDKYNLHDMALDHLCRLQAEVFLPTGNHFPPSYYLMKKVLGYVAADQFEGHICDNCSHVYPKLDKDKWAANQTCNTCGAKRFKTGRNKRLTPVKRFWDFGIDRILRTWFATPSTSEVLGQERDFNDAATFLGSPYGKMLDTMCNKKFSGPGENEMALYLSIGTTPTSALGRCHCPYHALHWCVFGFKGALTMPTLL